MKINKDYLCILGWFLAISENFDWLVFILDKKCVVTTFDIDVLVLSCVLFSRPYQVI